MYQPEWRDGREFGNADRDCDTRYIAIRDDLRKRWNADIPRRVLDLGAYTGYFALRLVEDFPSVHVVAVDDFPRLTRVAKDSRIDVINRRLTPHEIRALGSFDAVLCLSVLHHVPAWRDLLRVLTDITGLLFIESTSRYEDLPRAVAHSRKLCDAVDELGGRVLARTPGYQSDVLRDLKVIDDFVSRVQIHKAP